MIGRVNLIKDKVAKEIISGQKRYSSFFLTKEEEADSEKRDELSLKYAKEWIEKRGA